MQELLDLVKPLATLAGVGGTVYLGMKKWLRQPKSRNSNDSAKTENKGTKGINKNAATPPLVSSVGAAFLGVLGSALLILAIFIILKSKIRL